MDNTKYKWLQDILYEENPDIIESQIERIDNSISLHIFAGNYNWNNGFKIPNNIINNEYCDLGTALMLFYSADGYRMLEDEQGFASSNLDKWKEFLTTLYNRIINKQFKQQNIAFTPPLTKIQIFKLKKKSADISSIFLENLAGNEVEIPKL
ncbi:DUF4274 domain-containing protein [Clostridium kluyveri]|uniref:DUF4274 domain-containing protein n=1 Tax=Clostridium kluyveri TaxID=1534 RepID=A0A1L5F4B1_CLOKL|nr:DUF4274 domain-containing protein [Clostridium kluyveri]APM37846.1 hypothetical protein BS101_03385 [Clostridium kluyveri]UZQ52152.1 DUF4274 domain-containing protein [Clostridium kluyveri]